VALFTNTFSSEAYLPTGNSSTDVEPQSTPKSATSAPNMMVPTLPAPGLGNSQTTSTPPIENGSNLNVSYDSGIDTHSNAPSTNDERLYDHGYENSEVQDT
jgi:hypothetical protein